MSDDINDPAMRVRRVLESGIAAIEARMKELIELRDTCQKVGGKAKPADAKAFAQIITLTKEAAPLLGHIRRYDQALREATRGLTPALVIAYLRGLEPEKRAAILAELGVEADEAFEVSVLS